MKANEMPERIYIFDYNDAMVTPLEGDTTYVREDAFIEKAVEYFRRGLEDTKVIDDYRNILVRGIQASYTSVEEFIEDFKKYIKGE